MANCMRSIYCRISSEPVLAQNLPVSFYRRIGGIQLAQSQSKSVGSNSKNLLLYLNCPTVAAGSLFRLKS